MNDLFNDLVAVVQSRRKDGVAWSTIAAFDSKMVADKYAESCSSDESPWDYKVVDIEVAEEETKA